MIVQMVLKAIFFYILFLFVRSLIKGPKKSVHREGDAKSKVGGQHKRKQGPSEDIVDAEFRRL